MHITYDYDILPRPFWRKIMWWEALKYGPIAIAALTTFWTAGLLTIELNRSNVRHSARTLLVIFMGFCLIMTGLSWGLTIYDNTYVQRDAKLGTIRMLASQLDLNITNKYRIEGDADASVDERTRRQLGDVMRDICWRIQSIYEEAGGTKLRTNCEASLR
jgi:hypothetical protein